MIVGITTDRKLVVEYEAFKLHEQEGVNLGLQFVHLQKRGMIPSWIYIYLEGLKRMSKKAVDRTLSESLNFAYGKEYRDVIMNRIALYLEVLNIKDTTSHLNTDSDK